MLFDYQAEVKEIVQGKVKVCENEQDMQSLTDHIIRYANATLPNTLNDAIINTLIEQLVVTLLLQDDTEKNKHLKELKLGLLTAKYLTLNGLINPHYYISHSAPDSCRISNDYYGSVMPKEFCTCKNILLKDGKENIFLVIVPFEKNINIKELRRSLKGNINDCGKLQFVSSEEMKELLKVESGSLSLFSLIFDENNQVITILDDDLPKDMLMAFHPNYNRLSLFIFHSNDKSKDELELFIRSLGKTCISLKVPEKILIDDSDKNLIKKL